MKKFILAATALFSLGAAAYSDEAVTDAEALLRATQDRFAVGEVTRTDVQQAEMFVLEMKFQAGKIAKADYCAAIIPVVEGAVQGVVEEEKVGMRTIEDVIKARMEMHRVKALCK